MATKYPEIFAALAAPFPAGEVKTRQGGGGRQLSYITSRTAANRLDAVVGPERWESEFYEVVGCLACRITITMPDGSRVAKCDGGGFKQMTERNRAGQDVPDEENTDKTGFSDAFKRAASAWGVGRYLYKDGVPDYRDEGEPAAAPVPARQRGEPPSRPVQPPAQHHGDGAGSGKGGPPRTGRALFAWAGKMEEVHQVGLVKFLVGWGKLQEFPGRMVDWDAEQVRLGHAEAVRKLASVGGARRSPAEEARPAPAPPEAEAPGGGAESPTNPGPDAGRLGWDYYIDRVIGAWHAFDPISGDKDRTAREHRFAHAMATLAVQDGKLAESQILKPAEAGKPAVRDPARTWNSVKALLIDDRDWFINATAFYLDEKKAEALDHAPQA